MKTRSLGGDIVSNTSPTNCTPAFGELVLAGATAGVISTASSNEVLDSAYSTSGGCLAGAAFGVTQTIATGLLTIVRTGYYEVELDLPDYAATTGTGTVAFSVQKNAAAFAGEDVMTITGTAVAAVRISAHLKKIVRLVKNDTIRATVTAASTVVTINKGTLSVKQISDEITDLTVGA